MYSCFSRVSFSGGGVNIHVFMFFHVFLFQKNSNSSS